MASSRRDGRRPAGPADDHQPAGDHRPGGDDGAPDHRGPAGHGRASDHRPPAGILQPAHHHPAGEHRGPPPGAGRGDQLPPGRPDGPWRPGHGGDHRARGRPGHGPGPAGRRLDHVDPTLPPAQVGQVPEVAVRPVGEGWPGQAQLQWAGGLVRRAWQLAPMGLMGLVSWTVWLVRRLLSVRYQPVVNHYRTTTSVVVPAYREDPDVLEHCLRSWYRERPDEIIIVPDVEDAEVIERLERFALADPRIRVLPFQHRGKRSALGVGIRAARHDVVVLADSDTAWQPGLLAAVQMPFVDPMVGGVGTRQSVYLRDSSIWRRVADWLVSVRYLDYLPAQSRAGGVACLSGRTAAYRRSLLLPLLPAWSGRSSLAASAWPATTAASPG